MFSDSMKPSMLLTLFLLGEGFSDTLCPDTWVADRGSCYQFSPSTASNYANARLYCSQHHGHLVVVNDVYENYFLNDYIRRLKPMNWWIGLTDETVEGQWLWYPTKHAPTFKDWAPAEPDSNEGKHNEDCVSMHQVKDYKWVDIGCDEIFGPICEREANSGVVIG